MSPSKLNEMELHTNTATYVLDFEYLKDKYVGEAAQRLQKTKERIYDSLALGLDVLVIIPDIDAMSPLGDNRLGDPDPIMPFVEEMSGLEKVTLIATSVRKSLPQLDK